MAQKMALALHDLSAVGRAGLTQVFAALSAMGHQCVPLPTAVYSSHAGITGFETQDLTDWMRRALGQYQALGLTFDAVLSGFLNTPEQVACVRLAATCKKPDGIVLVDRDKCIGCQYCAMACPYGARTFNKKQKVVEKCTLCAHLQSVGDKPACVKCCSGAARLFGDAEDPESDVSKALAEVDPDAVHSMPDVGNGPSIRYILHSSIATWKELI